MQQTLRNYFILIGFVLVMGLFVTPSLVRRQVARERAPAPAPTRTTTQTADPLLDRFEEAIFTRAVENVRARDEEARGPLAEIIERRERRAVEGR